MWVRTFQGTEASYVLSEQLLNVNTPPALYWEMHKFRSDAFVPPSTVPPEQRMAGCAKRVLQCREKRVRSEPTHTPADANWSHRPLTLISATHPCCLHVPALWLFLFLLSPLS